MTEQISLFEDFTESPEPEPMSKMELSISTRDHQSTVDAFLRTIEEIFSLNHRSWNTFSDVVSLCRHTLMRYVPGTEEKYMEVVGRMQPEAVRAAPKAFAILQQHFTIDGRFEDILGSAYMELGSKWKQAGLGQFFTPWPVCLCMAQMNLCDMEEPTAENQVSIHEPCVGSGTMLLAAKNVVSEKYGRESLRHLKLSGQDIDPICVEMSEVQLALTDDWHMANLMIATAGGF